MDDSSGGLLPSTTASRARRRVVRRGMRGPSGEAYETKIRQPAPAAEQMKKALLVVDMTNDFLLKRLQSRSRLREGSGTDPAHQGLGGGLSELWATGGVHPRTGTSRLTMS